MFMRKQPMFEMPSNHEMSSAHEENRLQRAVTIWSCMVAIPQTSSWKHLA